MYTLTYYLLTFSFRKTDGSIAGLALCLLTSLCTMPTLTYFALSGQFIIIVCQNHLQIFFAHYHNTPPSGEGEVLTSVSWECVTQFFKPCPYFKPTIALFSIRRWCSGRVVCINLWLAIWRLWLSSNSGRPPCRACPRENAQQHAPTCNATMLLYMLGKNVARIISI